MTVTVAATGGDAAARWGDAALHLQLAQQADQGGSTWHRSASEAAAMEEDDEFGPETDVKACPGCQQIKPLSQFHRNRTK